MPEPTNPRHDPALPASPLPTDTVIVPYWLDTGDRAYEHGFARFADSCYLCRPELIEPVETGHSYDGEGITLMRFKHPVLAWCLDTNATQLCKAVIIIHKPCTDVWMVDTVEFARTMWGHLRVRPHKAA